MPLLAAWLVTSLYPFYSCKASSLADCEMKLFWVLIASILDVLWVLMTFTEMNLNYSEIMKRTAAMYNYKIVIPMITVKSFKKESGTVFIFKDKLSKGFCWWICFFLYICMLKKIIILSMSLYIYVYINTYKNLLPSEYWGCILDLWPKPCW